MLLLVVPGRAAGVVHVDDDIDVVAHGVRDTDDGYGDGGDDGDDDYDDDGDDDDDVNDDDHDVDDDDDGDGDDDHDDDDDGAGARDGDGDGAGDIVVVRQCCFACSRKRKEAHLAALFGR